MPDPGHEVRSRRQAPEKSLLEVCRYVDLNPVQARCCESPGDWRWSSYRAHVGIIVAPRWLATTELHAVSMGEEATGEAQTGVAQSRYADWVEGGRGVGSAAPGRSICGEPGLRPTGGNPSASAAFGAGVRHCLGWRRVVGGRRRMSAIRGDARPLRSPQAGFADVAPAAIGAGAPSPQPPPSARIRPTVAWYCAARTCTATRRFASSLRRASSSSS